MEREASAETVDVLIVDDNEDLRAIIAAVIREVLGEEQCRVIEAADNVAGLERLLSAPRPLVALLDMYMGPLPFDVLLSILASPTAPLAELLRRHRYIVLTASPQRVGERERKVLAGPLDHAPVVGKPFDLDDLEEILRAAVARLAARERKRERAQRQAQRRARELVAAGR